MSESTFVDPYVSAQKTGERVVLPEPREVLLDLDTEEDWEQMNKMRGILAGLGLYLQVVDTHPSKSGLPHRHVTLAAPRALTPIERVALQACLGSDRKRETLSLARIFLGDPAPATVFFEPKLP